eukprot:s2737_g22.t1
MVEFTGRRNSRILTVPLMSLAVVGPLDNLGDQFRIHLEQISDDFRKLGLEISPVLFQGERPDDTLENQFQEAFGENYQNKLPASPDKNSPASAKYQRTKTISRSDSGLPQRTCTPEMIKRFLIETTYGTDCVKHYRHGRCCRQPS